MFGREDRSGLECGAPTPNTDETTLEGWVTMGRGWKYTHRKRGIATLFIPFYGGGKI